MIIGKDSKKFKILMITNQNLFAPKIIKIKLIQNTSIKLTMQKVLNFIY